MTVDKDVTRFWKKENNNNKKIASLGGLEPPTFRLTAERANRLRHRDNMTNMLSLSRTTHKVIS